MTNTSNFPNQYVFIDGRLDKYDHSLYDGDPRGIFWMWEKPKPGHVYYMGIDPTVGRTGWVREARKESDLKTDNGAIIVVRKGKGGAPDVQVAEYAAPIDSFELGYVANLIGRVYGQPDEDDQCKCIIETYPGPGGGTMQTMLGLGYTNLWRWEYYADTPVSPTKAIGWQANPKNNRNLWVKGSRLLCLKNAVVKSPWLYSEYCDLEIQEGSLLQPEMVWARASSGSHDDRVRAHLLCLWACNGWSTDIETVAEKPRLTDEPKNWAASDMSWEQIQEEWEDLVERMEEE